MQPIKILVIDDDLDDIYFYREAFEKKLRFDFSFYQDAQLALDMLQKMSPQQVPDLILCDLNMPLFNGFEILSRVKTFEHLDETCFIICSNSTLPSDRQKAKSLGADAYFVKPLTFNQYAELIEEIIITCGFEHRLVFDKTLTSIKHRVRVMLVEDNEDERIFMKEGFAQTGLYEIIGEAENGKEMLEFLNDPEMLPELIVSDLNMPVKDGYEVISDIKSNKTLSDISVVILTTAPLVPYAERCKKMGACAYFTKPETFLDYPAFAKAIYPDILHCVQKKN